MLLKFFSKNRLSVIIIIILLPVVYWIPYAMPKTLDSSVIQGALPARFIWNFNHNYGFLSALITFLLIIVNAYLLVQLNTIHIFIPVRTQLPALFYVMLVLAFNQVHQLSPALIASSLIIFLLYRLFISYKTDGISLNFLDGGLLIATASLLYFPLVLFFPLLFIGMVLLRPLNWREWAYSVIGFALPYCFLASACFLLDVQFRDYFSGSGLFKYDIQRYDISQLITIGYVFAMLVYASYFMMRSIDNMKIQSRKNFMFFLWLFLFSVIIYLGIPGTHTEVIYFMAVPLSMLFSHYFVKCTINWLNELLFSLFFLLLILQKLI
jgi:hypothetical protein